MTVGRQYQLLRSALEAIYPTDEAAAIASVLIEYHTGISRFQIPLQKNELVRKSVSSVIEQNLVALLQHQPLQYVINEAWFYGLRFYVDASVLIPRPETEELVHEAIQHIRDKHAESENIKLVDVGTGSGCIPIAIKKECDYVDVTSVDISEDALIIARKNALDNTVSVRFEHLDFLDEKCWQQLGKVDIIISNPPYITLQEKNELEKNVSEWEPGTALFVPNDDPLLFYRKICEFANQQLNEEGLILLECHYQFARQTNELFLQAGYQSILKKDMNGNDRMVIARKQPGINR